MHTSAWVGRGSLGVCWRASSTLTGWQLAPMERQATCGLCPYVHGLHIRKKTMHLTRELAEFHLPAVHCHRGSVCCRAPQRAQHQLSQHLLPQLKPRHPRLKKQRKQRPVLHSSVWLPHTPSVSLSPALIVKQKCSRSTSPQKRQGLLLSHSQSCQAPWTLGRIPNSRAHQRQLPGWPGQ